jgi:predicted PhzF superfamily epimerase YddE/YHI9
MGLMIVDVFTERSLAENQLAVLPRPSEKPGKKAAAAR